MRTEVDRYTGVFQKPRAERYGFGGEFEGTEVTTDQGAVDGEEEDRWRATEEHMGAGVCEAVRGTDGGCYDRCRIGGRRGW